MQVWIPHECGKSGSYATAAHFDARRQPFDVMQVYKAPSRRGGRLELITEYEGLGGNTGGSMASSSEGRSSGDTVAPKPPITVVFYGQHYDALLDEGLRPQIRSEL